MRMHQASEIRYGVNILGTDGVTVLAADVGAGIEDLSGRRLEQAQLISSETSHMILLWYLDALKLPNQGHIQVIDPGTGETTLYLVDYVEDPRKPRPRVWTEVYCHVERGNS